MLLGLCKAIVPISTLIASLTHDALGAKWCCHALHGLCPDTVVARLPVVTWIGRGLPLAPDAQDAAMNQVDPPLPVELVEATDDVIGVESPLAPPPGTSCPLPTRRQ